MSRIGPACDLSNIAAKNGVECFSGSSLELCNDLRVVLLEESVYLSLVSSCGSVYGPSVEYLGSEKAGLVCCENLIVGGVACRLNLIKLIVHISDVDESVGGCCCAVEHLLCAELENIPIIALDILCNTIAHYSHVQVVVGHGLGSAPSNLAVGNCTASPSIIIIYLTDNCLVSLESSSELALLNASLLAEVCSSSLEIEVSVGGQANVVAVYKSCSSVKSFLELVKVVVLRVADFIVKDVLLVVYALPLLDEVSELSSGVAVHVLESLNHQVSSGVVLSSSIGISENVLSVLESAEETLSRNRALLIDVLVTDILKAFYESLKICLVLSCLGFICIGDNCNRAERHYRCHSRSKNSSS